MTETELTLNERIVKLTERVLEADWTPDKDYTVKGNKVDYVSTPKLLRQTAPLLVEAGLTLTVRDESTEIIKPIGMKENHVYLTTVFILSDGKESREYRVIAESADTGDKALSFAHSYARRLFWTMNFPIVDGLEDMTESIVTSQDVTANLLRRAVKETEPDNVPIPVTAKAEPDKAQSVPAVESEGDVVKAEGPVTSPGDSNLSPIQILAMNNALEAIQKADKEGKIIHQHAVTAREIRARASCQADVQALLNLRKELGL